MYKGVIFDLDGTLVNSIEDIGNSLNRVLETRHLPLSTVKQYTARIGQGLYQLVIDSTPENTSKEVIDEIFEEFVKDYGKNYLIKTKPYDGINEMLEALVKEGILLGVNSNKKDEFTKEIVKTLFPKIPFTLVLGDRVDVKKKPDPTSALEIIAAMGLSHEDVVYVGDTDHDMHTAHNAQIDSIGVSWGYRTLDVLNNEGAVHTVREVSEIVDVVLK